MKLVEYLFLLLRQFVGGPGPLENNLVRFGLPAIVWAVLVAIAWNRQRTGEHPREAWLVWGFGFGFVREFFMVLHVSLRIANPAVNETQPFIVMEPLEHALELIAVAIVAGAFIRYVLIEEHLARRFMLVAIAISIVCYATASPSWIREVQLDPEVRFHQTWGAWAFHGSALVLIGAAIFILLRKRTWLSTVVILTLALFFLAEALLLLNYASGRAYADFLCPIGNSLHILAVPLLGFIYLREQALEQREAETQLAAYRGHLEELVTVRTEELTTTNRKLMQEIVDRQRAEAALSRLSRHHELILNSAGEGIFGVDVDGHHTFVNRAAADMLGYEPNDLIGGTSHAVWHHSYADGTPYPEADCPLHNGYKTGKVRQGDDQVFWRRDGTSFPVHYVSTPIYENGDLRGAVVIFQDVSEAKRAQAEIVQRSSELALQNTIAATLSQSLDLQRILDTTLETALGALEVEAGCIHLTNGNGLTLAPEATCGGQQYKAWACCSWCQAACRRIAQEAVEAGLPVTLAVTHGDECPEPECLCETPTNTLLSIPLMAKGKAVGALTLAARHTDGLTANTALLTSIGNQIGVAVENARLHQETQRWADQLAALHGASVRLNATLELDQIYAGIVEESMRLLRCHAAALFLWQEYDQAPVRVLARGLQEIDAETAGAVDAQQQLPVHLSPEEVTRLSGHIRAHEMLVVPDVALDDRLELHWSANLGLQAILGLPLWGADRPLGFVFIIDRESKRAWRQDEIDLAESFGNLASIILEKARLHSQAERAAALEERQRLAADMHDGLAQTLSYLGHQVDGLTEFAGLEAPSPDLPDRGRADHIIAASARMRAIIDDATAEVRRFITGLHVQPRPPRPLQRLLEDTVSAEELSDGLITRFETDLDASLFVSEAVGEQITRIVKEAVRNARNHARATHVVVTLRTEAGRAIVTIADDGRGFDPEAHVADGRGHFGLNIMRVRAARVAGSLDVRSIPKQGTSVVLTWPIGPAGNNDER
ncbi:MAG: GAF domain-containing protein [Anaerolineae bacterium]|nr:GAF domain-containing protein [Anaerolineae bacterium]